MEPKIILWRNVNFIIAVIFIFLTNTTVFSQNTNYKIHTISKEMDSFDSIDATPVYVDYSITKVAVPVTLPNGKVGISNYKKVNNEYDSIKQNSFRQNDACNMVVYVGKKNNFEYLNCN